MVTSGRIGCGSNSLALAAVGALVLAWTTTAQPQTADPLPVPAPETTAAPTRSEIVDWSTELDDPAVQSELRSAPTVALQQLPDHYRAVTILHDVEGLSMAEVADRLNITVATAKSRAHRARLLLRRRLAVFMAGATSAVEMASSGSLRLTSLPAGTSSHATERRT